MTEGTAMGKQYVFWRTPDGKRCRAKDGKGKGKSREDDNAEDEKGQGRKNAPTALLAQLGKSAEKFGNGKIGWQDILIHRLILAIRSVIVILDPGGNELNDTDSWSIVWRAIETILKRQGGGKPIASTDLIDEANKEAAKHFRTSLTEYIIVSSLSVAELPSSHIRVRDCEISPVVRRDGRFAYPDALKRQAMDTAFARHIASTKYLPVKVKTAGRSQAEAVAKALDSLSLLRGLWTLFATYGAWSMRLGGIKKYTTLGVIHAGPIDTLHNSVGASVDEIWWYNPDYAGDQAIFSPSNGWSQVEKDRRWAMRRLRSLPYKSDVEELIERYAAALDQTNLDVTFLYLWGLLEKITDTVGGNYDETIRRATRIYKDRHIAKGLLESLRRRRNRLVHAARSAEDRDQVAYLVKYFVDPHLVWLIRNELHLQSLKEYGEFLSLPGDVPTLEKRQRRLNQALRMARKWGSI